MPTINKKTIIETPDNAIRDNTPLGVPRVVEFTITRFDIIGQMSTILHDFTPFYA